MSNPNFLPIAITFIIVLGISSVTWAIAFGHKTWYEADTRSRAECLQRGGSVVLGQYSNTHCIIMQKALSP